MTVRAGHPLRDGVCVAQDVVVHVPKYTAIAVVFDEHGRQDIRSMMDIGFVDVPAGEGIHPSDERALGQRVDHDGDRDWGELRRARFLRHADATYVNLEDDKARLLGGRMLLAQTSWVRSQMEGEARLYSPVSLNLRHDVRQDGLYELVRTGDLSLVECVGDGYNDDEALSLKVMNNTHSAVRFVIPQGAVFEQSEWTGNQNLVVPRDVWVDVGPGDQVTFPVPGMCANRSAGVPSGDTMRVTPFIMENRQGAFATQDGVWVSTDGGRSRQGHL